MERSVRERDGQQWIYDWMLKTTGRAIHFEMDGRDMPPQAKNIKMVAKYLAKEGEHSEKLAQAAEAKGDKISARALYRYASEHYREAQHFVIPAMGSRRWELYAKCRECAEHLYNLVDYPVELVEIPCAGGTVPGGGESVLGAGNSV